MDLPALAPAALVSFVLIFVQAGAALVQFAVLAYLARLFKRSWAEWWAAGWGALVVALFSVQLWVVTGRVLFRGTFLLFEWIFAGALLAGAREYSRGSAVSRRLFSRLVLAAVVPAVLGAMLPGTFDDLFALQAIVLSTFFLLSFRELGKVEAGERGAGWTVMRTTLLFLAVVFLAWVPLFGVQSSRPVSNWISLSSVLDMLLEVGLGFGMVVAVSESAGAELRRTVRDLEAARSELERSSRTDPLTGVLNRRAVEQFSVLTSGTAVMVDIDGLKEINDRYGHAAGDEAIRSAAEELRQRTRAGDSVFRWGGDEFLVVLPGAPESAVLARFADLEVGGTFVPPGGPGPAALRLSWGSAAFGPPPFAEAVALADERMYARRARRRGAAPSSA